VGWVLVQNKNDPDATVPLSPISLQDVHTMNIYELSGNEHDDNYNLTNSQPGNTVVATTPFNPLNGFHIAHSWSN